MGAPIGNRFWEARSSHGRKPKFETPEDLAGACYEYFEWNEQNPLYAVEPFAYQGEVKLQSIPKLRVMTLTALCRFIGMTTAGWDDYRKKGNDFADVCAEAEMVVRDQKFSGATAGFFNAMIIARDLGLRDNIANEHSGPNGGPIKSAAVIVGTQDPSEAARAYKQLMDGEND